MQSDEIILYYSNSVAKIFKGKQNLSVDDESLDNKLLFLSLRARIHAEHNNNYVSQF